MGNQKLIPKFHVMVLIANKNDNAYLYMYTSVSMSRQDCYLSAIENMKKDEPELYEKGRLSEKGFVITNHQAFSLSEIQANFRIEIDKENIHQPPKMNIEIHEATEITASPEVIKKNKLIDKIIRKASEKYLDKHAHKLNGFEIAYIREKITKE